MKLLVLDLDGVVNQMELQPNGFYPIDRSRMLLINRLVAETGAQVVISSSWRYMILGGAMTLRGFDMMLRTHGYDGPTILGCTCPDEYINVRGLQIKNWLETSGVKFGVTHYVILDDLDEGPYHISSYHPRNFVHTVGSDGLTEGDVVMARRILEGAAFAGEIHSAA